MAIGFGCSYFLHAWASVCWCGRASVETEKCTECVSHRHLKSLLVVPPLEIRPYALGEG